MKNIDKYSNPKIVQNKANELLGKNVKVELSTRKDKKYMIEGSDGKKIHFGQFGYEDFTKHNDVARRNAFLARNKKWKQSDKNTPAWLSYNLLW